ncbi:ABC transporter [Erythrobacter sp. KY5]|uniref:ABC transporter ATP-binding protein n=1 Tax=Erythrobacter sp. KY5 TaxID=2011159 RepID=UPI000DBF0374|nr:ABC transporter ATP-binding protein [Erythrobacter sp. KY5]AWW72916.1 ABC transporter [Erythrobacter sp. KY5]
MSFGFWLQWARRFRGQLTLISVLTLLSSGATLAVPWLAARVLGGVISAEQVSDIDVGQVLTLLVAALVALTALNVAAAILSERASTRILTELRIKIYNHVQMLRLGFHDDARRGDVLALTSYEVGNLSDFLAGTIANAPAMILTAAGAIIILFAIDPVMAAIVPLLIPAFYILVRLSGRRLRRLSSEVRAAEVELITLAERDLEMLPAIKAFATEEQHQTEFAAAADRSRRLAVRQAQWSVAIGPVMALVAALAAIAVLVFGSEQLLEADRSPSDLFAFLFYAALLTQPAGALAKMYGSYQMARGTLARLEAVLDHEPEPGYQGGKGLERARGAIQFHQVGFGYSGRPRLFSEFNFEVKPGEIVALTGENGVGKSTLIRLLLRFYEPLSGSITLDGIPISDYQVQDLRRQFGYVPQRAFLFNGTIAENIVFGQPDPNPKEAIDRAAKLAQASDFIASLPDGVETVIGDNGVRLSGGQRQRIALARALYSQPPIHILDEATSMYDIDGEAAFVEECIGSLKGRTVIIITHRPASLALADRVLKLGTDGRFEVDH